MDQKQLTTLIGDMKRFFLYVQELAQSISRRINHSEKLNEFITLARDLTEKMTQKIDHILQDNVTLRDQLMIILNTGNILNLTINKQIEIINDLKIIEVIDLKQEKKMMFKILMLSESLQKGLFLIQHILDRINEMILLDYRISRHKNIIGNEINKLTEMGNRFRVTVNDDWKSFGAVNKQKDSTDEFITQTSGIIESADRQQLSGVLETIKDELRMEEMLSSNMMSQIPFVDDMYGFVQLLHAFSISIRNLVDAKTTYYRDNLEEVAQLSVILSLEIEDFLKIREIYDPNKSDSKPSLDGLRMLSELSILFDVACDTIRDLIELNNYVVEIFDTNAKREEQVVELSGMYVRSYDNIRKEVEAATNVMNFISEGARNNIIVGLVLEKNLKKLLDNIS